MPETTVTVIHLLDTPAAAEMLDLAAETLTTWRRKRIGPPFVRIGNKVRYRVTDLNDWLDRQTVSHTGSPTPQQD